MNQTIPAKADWGNAAATNAPRVGKRKIPSMMCDIPFPRRGAGPLNCDPTTARTRIPFRSSSRDQINPAETPFIGAPPGQRSTPLGRTIHTLTETGLERQSVVRHSPINVVHQREHQQLRRHKHLPERGGNRGNIGRTWQRRHPATFRSVTWNRQPRWQRLRKPRVMPTSGRIRNGLIPRHCQMVTATGIRRADRADETAQHDQHSAESWPIPNAHQSLPAQHPNPSRRT